ncbi:MAG: hypothetical protein ACRDL7_09150, partial [Gaiellaceae bacterium]
AASARSGAKPDAAPPALPLENDPESGVEAAVIRCEREAAGVPVRTRGWAAVLMPVRASGRRGAAGRIETREAAWAAVAGGAGALTALGEPTRVTGRVTFDVTPTVFAM